MIRPVTHVPVDEIFYWRCLVPCTIRDREPRLAPEQIGALHAAMIAYLDGTPLRVENYRAAQAIVAEWWGMAERRDESQKETRQKERRRP